MLTTVIGQASVFSLRVMGQASVLSESVGPDVFFCGDHGATYFPADGMGLGNYGCCCRELGTRVGSTTEERGADVQSMPSGNAFKRLVFQQAAKIRAEPWGQQVRQGVSTPQSFDFDGPLDRTRLHSAYSHDG